MIERTSTLPRRASGILEAKKSLRLFLPELAAWQRAHDFPFELSTHISARHLLSHASAIKRVDPRCLRDDSLKETLSSIPTGRPFLCPAKLIRGEEQFGAAFWDEHVGSLLATSPHLEIVQYKQRGHHPHRMLGFEQRFFYDLEDFVAKT